MYVAQIQEADKKLRDRCMASAKRLYGENLPNIVKVRLDRELLAISQCNHATHYIIATAMADCSLYKGYHITTRGTIGSSLVAFFSGITEINPLEAHYRCPSCHYFELSENKSEYDYVTGYDLPEKKCPVCGKLLIGDGANIMSEMSMGTDMRREPDVIMNFSPEVIQDVFDALREMFGKDNVIGAGVSVNAEDGTRKTGVHPGGIFIVPAQVEISDITGLRNDVRDDGIHLMVTERHYRDVEKYLKKYDVLPKPELGILHEMEITTGVPVKSISMYESELFDIDDTDERNSFLIDGRDWKAFGIVHPQGFSEMVIMLGLAHTDFFDGNGDISAENILEAKRHGIYCRDDILETLLRKGCDIHTSYTIMNSISRGKGVDEMAEKTMHGCGMSDDYIGFCKRIKYLFPRSMMASYALVNWRMAFYKAN